MNRQPGCIAKSWHRCVGPINHHRHCLGSTHPAGRGLYDEADGPRIDTAYDEAAERDQRDLYEGNIE